MFRGAVTARRKITESLGSGECTRGSSACLSEDGLSISLVNRDTGDSILEAELGDKQQTTQRREEKAVGSESKSD